MRHLSPQSHRCEAGDDLPAAPPNSPSSSSCRKLSNIAFGDMNPFPRRLLRNRRALHLERLQGELQRLAEQQEEFVTERAERKDKDLDPAASEDDDL